MKIHSPLTLKWNHKIMKKRVLLNCKRGNKKLYDEIFESKYFKGTGEKDLSYALIFTLSISYGFKNNNFIPIKSGTEWITRAEYITKNDEFIAFFRAVAISKSDDVFIINDEEKIFEIAEGYANGGINRLHSDIFGKNVPDFDKILEEIINKI
jgi:hypothetical protein